MPKCVWRECEGVELPVHRYKVLLVSDERDLYRTIQNESRSFFTASSWVTVIPVRCRSHTPRHPRPLRNMIAGAPFLYRLVEIQ
jgi:hypothetical protein